MRTFLIFLSLWLSLTAGVRAAETYVLADGSSVAGDIVKFDDHDAMMHTTADGYTNINWPQFGQDALKRLAENPKLRAYATPFIQPTAGGRAPEPKINVRYEKPVTLPEHPSILGGMFSSSLGLFILLVVYAANLYAAYEIAVVRNKPLPMVMGVSAVLPIAGPVIFLAQPVKAPPAEEAVAEETGAAALAPGTAAAPAAAGATGPGAHEDIQIVSASWQPAQEEKKPQPQVFSRGKFTFNKRFIETKFANFIGEPKGEGKNFTMEIKTLKDTIAVECIKQVGASEAILETPTGQLALPFADIQEVKLTPKPAASA